jgi:hypothetical protein
MIAPPNNHTRMLFTVWGEGKARPSLRLGLRRRGPALTFSYYESKTGQPIARELARYLAEKTST